jgi:hypothetical protein
MKARDVSEILAVFDKLPDSAVVPRKVTALVTGKSERAVRRNPPVPDRKITGYRVGHNVGDLRRYLSATEAA